MTGLLAILKAFLRSVRKHAPQATGPIVRVGSVAAPLESYLDRDHFDKENDR